MLNVCPVYTRTGGHAYGSVYPGPIGAILTPMLTGIAGHQGDPNSSLPYASSLCGACYDVCPVKIDIPTILVELRAQVVDADRHRMIPGGWDAALKAASWVMSDEKRFAVAERVSPSGDSPVGARAGSGTSPHRCPGGPPAGTYPAHPPKPSATGGRTTTRTPLPTPGPQLERGNHDHQPRHRHGQDPGRAGR